MGRHQRFGRDEQLAYLSALDERVAGAPPEALTLALLRGLVAAHHPHRWQMQCLGKFDLAGGERGCSLCATHGEPVAVNSPEWNESVVFHTHLAPDPSCQSCGLPWPCRFVEVVRTTLTP